MSKFSHFAVKKHCFKCSFKHSFNTISGSRGPFYSKINFDQSYLGGGGLSGGFWRRGFARGFMFRGFLSGGFMSIFEML